MKTFVFLLCPVKLQLKVPPAILTTKYFYLKEDGAQLKVVTVCTNSEIKLNGGFDWVLAGRLQTNKSELSFNSEFVCSRCRFRRLVLAVVAVDFKDHSLSFK